MKKQNQGITLIALVITIIVILILAGVTIVTLTGDNGLFGKTSEAKFITEIEQYNEELKLAITEDYTNSMGNRQNKFNVRRNSYNDENSFTNAMKTKIPSFNSKYANKLEIKEDKLNYIGDNEQEREWLAEVISVAGILKINYVYENGTQAATPYQQVIPDGSYEVESPKIDGYEPDHYIVSGKINGDTNVTVTYYPPSQGLEYELLDDGTYTVAGPSTYALETLVVPREYNSKAVTQISTSAFSNNERIKKLIVTDQIQKIHSKSFEYCKNLVEANINSNRIESSCVFQYCGKLKTIELGKNTTFLGTECFRYCKNLENVFINSEELDLDASQFIACGKINIIISDDNKKYTIENQILYSKDFDKIYMCFPSKTGEIIISSSVKEICEKSFYSINGITKITIPKSIEKIGSTALRYMSNVNTLYYNGTIQDWENINKGWSWKTPSSITQVICLDGTVDL